MEIYKRYFDQKAPTEVDRAYRADFYTRQIEPGLPSPVDLSLLAEREPIDVVSQFFYKSILKSTRYGAAIRRIDEAKEVYSGDFDQLQVVTVLGFDQLDLKGWEKRLFFMSHLAEDAGFRVLPVWSHPGLSLSENAYRLLQILRTDVDRPFIIMTFGNASLYVRMVLEKRGEEKFLENFKGWVSLSGSQKGSLLLSRKLQSPIDRALLRIKSMQGGVSFDSLSEQADTYPLWQKPITLPRGFKFTSIFGVPLEANVHPSLRSSFSKLKAHGPSDGVSPIAHMLPIEGECYPIWNCDFFLRRVDVPTLIKKVLCNTARLTL